MNLSFRDVLFLKFIKALVGINPCFAVLELCYFASGKIRM